MLFAMTRRVEVRKCGLPLLGSGLSLWEYCSRVCYGRERMKTLVIGFLQQDAESLLQLIQLHTSYCQKALSLL
jgi:hypothetical protein